MTSSYNYKIHHKLIIHESWLKSSCLVQCLQRRNWLSIDLRSVWQFGYSKVNLNFLHFLLFLLMKNVEVSWRSDSVDFNGKFAGVMANINLRSMQALLILIFVIESISSTIITNIIMAFPRSAYNFNENVNMQSQLTITRQQPIANSIMKFLH